MKEIASIFCAYEVQQQHQLIATHSPKSSQHETKSKDQREFTFISTNNPSTKSRQKKYDPDEETDDKYGD